MADPAMPRRPRRLWRVLFAISLALNLAIAGLVVGFVLRDDRSGPPRGFDVALGPIGGALSRNDRRAVLRDIRQNVDLPRGGLGQDMEAVVAALSADPFDPAALEDAMAQGKARRDRVLDTATAALVRHVSAMSPQERVAFAARIAEHRGPWRKKY